MRAYSQKVVYMIIFLCANYIKDGPGSKDSGILLNAYDVLIYEIVIY